MSQVTVAATQMACSENVDENYKKAEKVIRQAAKQGAQIILIQELFLRHISVRMKKQNILSMHRR